MTVLADNSVDSETEANAQKAQQQNNATTKTTMSTLSPTTPAPPPPPPPTTVAIAYTQEDHNNNKGNCPKSIACPITECSWAKNDSRLQFACYMARVCLHECPLLVQYYGCVLGIKQNGPTCGLTALSMLLKHVNDAELLREAKARGYTNQGEMFSALQLQQLAKDYANDDNVQCELHKGLLDCEHIKERLKAGDCMLVPYDADHTHRPYLRKGHGAHWAAIVGYLITKDEQFHVLALQGKSYYLTLWPLKNLSDSNANLMEYAPSVRYENLEYKLPEGGVGGELGLRERAILLKNLPLQRITYQY